MQSSPSWVESLPLQARRVLEIVRNRTRNMRHMVFAAGLPLLSDKREVCIVYYVARNIAGVDRVAEFIGVHRNTVLRWIENVEKHGTVALYDYVARKRVMEKIRVEECFKVWREVAPGPSPCCSV